MLAHCSGHCVGTADTFLSHVLPPEIRGTHKMPWTVCDHFHFSLQFFFRYLNFWKLHSCDGGVSCTYNGALNSFRNFFFRSKFIFLISISEYRTGATEVSAVPIRCPEPFSNIFTFRLKFLFKFKGTSWYGFVLLNF